MIRDKLRWLLAVTAAVTAAFVFSPNIATSAFARGGGGGGGGGGGRGGRGGGGGSRGGRGGGGLGGGSAGKNKGKKNANGSKVMDDALDYLTRTQREEADNQRGDFIFDRRDDELVGDRDRERDRALAEQREAAAAKRRQSN